MKEENKMSLTQNVMVSVIMATYNHERYIRQALDSVLNQKVNFEYEIIIGDDCSTDSTQGIISEYIDKYPKIFKAELRNKNIGAKYNGYDLMMKCTGKYVAFLEGDDYWTDENKLQKQVDFLEKNHQYIGCSHKFNVVNNDGIEYYDRDFLVQFCTKREYTLKDFEKGLLSSHINTLVYRNIYREDSVDLSFWTEFDNMAGDVVINLILTILGRIYCMDEVMSCYRKVTDKTSSSFSAKQERENRRDILFFSQIDLEKIIWENFHKKVSFVRRKKNIFASAVFKWYREKNECNKNVVENIIKNSGHPIKYSLFEKYLLIMKKIMQLIYREDRRIPY